ncbi:hypothetical protein [Leptospira santarosai]|uniref:hypothetical protein n=1 Tax=Leptospira santarosai TaxID=28183 RepID=UPI00035DA8A1|nr:hypothetical protein [Leptospira santarosai]
MSQPDERGLSNPKLTLEEYRTPDHRDLTEDFEPEGDPMQEPDYYFCMCCGTQTGGHAFDCPRCMGPMEEGYF